MSRDASEITSLIRLYKGTACEVDTASHMQPSGLRQEWLCVNLSFPKNERNHCISSILRAAVPAMCPGYVVDDVDLFSNLTRGFTCLIARKQDRRILVVFNVELRTGGRYNVSFLKAIDLQGLTRAALIQYELELRLSAMNTPHQSGNASRRWDRSAFAQHIVGVMACRRDFMQFGFTCVKDAVLCVHDEWMFPIIVGFATNSATRQRGVADGDIAHHVFEIHGNRFVTIRMHQSDGACISSLISLGHSRFLIDPFGVRYITRSGIIDMNITAKIRALVTKVCNYHGMYDPQCLTRRTGDDRLAIAVSTLAANAGLAMLQMVDGEAPSFFFRAIDPAIMRGSQHTPEHLIAPVLEFVFGCKEKDMQFYPLNEFAPETQSCLIDLADEVVIEYRPDGYSFTLIEHGLSRRNAPAGVGRNVERANEFRQLLTEGKDHFDLTMDVNYFIDTVADAKRSFLAGATELFVYSIQRTDYDHKPSSLFVASVVSLEFITPVLRYVFGCDEMFCSYNEENKAGELFVIDDVGDVMVTPKDDGFLVSVFTRQ